MSAMLCISITIKECPGMFRSIKSSCRLSYILTTYKRESALGGMVGPRYINCDLFCYTDDISSLCEQKIMCSTEPSCHTDDSTQPSYYTDSSTQPSFLTDNSTQPSYHTDNSTQTSFLIDNSTQPSYHTDNPHR